MSKEQNKSGHLIDEATKTPRTQAAIKTYGDYIRSEDAVSIEFAEQLETELAEAQAENAKLRKLLATRIEATRLDEAVDQLAEARAEIEILKNQLEDESMRADGMTTAHAEAGADSYRMRELIEQMREALELVIEGAIHDFHYVCQHRDNCLCWGCQKKRIKAALSVAERGE